MAKNLEISYLLDFYSEMLTQKQREVIEYYYNDDLSLSEIAMNEGITRQGVRIPSSGRKASFWRWRNVWAFASGFGKCRKCWIVS